MQKSRTLPFLSEPGLYMFGGGFYTSNLFYIMIKNTLDIPEYSRNILGEESFHTSWSVQLAHLYRIVILTPSRSFRRPSEWPSGHPRHLRDSPLTFGPSPSPSGVAANLRVSLLTFGPLVMWTLSCACSYCCFVQSFEAGVFVEPMFLSNKTS